MASSLSTRLTDAQRATYRERGYHVPLRAFSEEDATQRYRRFLDYWQPHGEKLKARPPREWGPYLIDTHLFLRWVCDIVLHPRVLDAVESVLGPDIMVWGSQWFPKFAHDKAYVSWHQDAAYWGLSPLNVTTAWIALVPSTRENGCMRVVPGTHRGLLPQRETYAEANMLSRGQEIAVEVDESAGRRLRAAAGRILPASHRDRARVRAEHVGHIACGACGPLHFAGRRAAGQRPRYGAAGAGTDDYGHFDIVVPPLHDLPSGRARCIPNPWPAGSRNVLPAGAGDKK